MQQVLAALEGGDVMCEVIAAGMLRTELAKPEREPVAYLVRKKTWREGHWDVGPTDSPDYGRTWADERIAVYTLPPVRRTLTNKEIQGVIDKTPRYDEYGRLDPCADVDLFDLSRAIEARHGITGDIGEAMP
jgi:hypothetical protein